MTSQAFPLEICRLLQLTSPALPVGSYSYSEGIEYLCHQGTIANALDLSDWLHQELQMGFIKIETAIAIVAAQAWSNHDLTKILYWNNWLSATRETEEMRFASWQMGQSLIKLWMQLRNDEKTNNPHNSNNQNRELLDQLLQLLPMAKNNASGKGCNYAIAFGLVAADWAIAPEQIAIGYIYSWAANLISAAVRSVPLGQTTGQQVSFDLGAAITQGAAIARSLAASLDQQPNGQQLEWCGWGANIASANHETQYSRLFRS